MNVIYGYSIGGAEPRSPAELYGVFRRPRSKADERAGRGIQLLGGDELPAEAFADMDPETLALIRADDQGQVLEEEGRLLLKAGDEVPHDLYAAPTTTGRISFRLGFGGTCSPAARDGLILTVPFRSGDSVIACGLVADGITGIDILDAQGGSHSARLGENGFTVRIKGRDVEPLKGLVLHREDGSTTQIPLD